ncbi:MAG TPA: hypothetical protein PKD00_06605 [Burkholderiales bacterium]|nr:hypothetical protein [Burkholderiales bacterium]
MENKCKWLDNFDEMLLWSAEDFLKKVTIPAHWSIASQNNIRFTINDISGRLIICSEKYAHDIGFNNFYEAMFKMPGKDYKPFFKETNYFIAQKNSSENKKKVFHYIYKANHNGIIYLSTSEPILDLKGNTIATKDVDLEVKPITHREVIEKHFKRNDINLVAPCLEDVAPIIPLTENEELILFMLIAGYSQQEIGVLLNYSRSYIVKIIAEGLCVKFGLPALSTKALIDKAVSMGYALFIPNKFLDVLNDNLNEHELLNKAI